jgi:hypothetical protein
MTLNELHQFFQSKGWKMKPNSTAYYHPQVSGTRYKINKLVVRKERSSLYNGWTRIASAYISQIEISPEGKMTGFKREF